LPPLGILSDRSETHSLSESIIAQSLASLATAAASAFNQISGADRIASGRDRDLEEGSSAKKACVGTSPRINTLRADRRSASTADAPDVRLFHNDGDAAR